MHDSPQGGDLAAIGSAQGRFEAQVNCEHPAIQEYQQDLDGWGRHALAANGFGDY